jgi:hypothetical protein
MDGMIRNHVHWSSSTLTTTWQKLAMLAWWQLQGDAQNSSMDRWRWRYHAAVVLPNKYASSQCGGSTWLQQQQAQLAENAPRNHWRFHILHFRHLRHSKKKVS